MRWRPKALRDCERSRSEAGLMTLFVKTGGLRSIQRFDRVEVAVEKSALETSAPSRAPDVMRGTPLLCKLRPISPGS